MVKENTCVLMVEKIAYYSGKPKAWEGGRGGVFIQNLLA